MVFIFFAGDTDFIDNDNYYNNPGENIFEINKHTDGIDVYLYGDNVCLGGMANGIAISSELYVGAYVSSFPSLYLANSRVVSHEMGHVLGLYHTHHGTFYGEVDNTTCAELVNGSNSTTCGDFISDTPADPNLNYNVNPVTCEWLGVGETDVNGDLYQPDTRLIMSYTHPLCMSYFSEEQGYRMKSVIGNSHMLNNATIYISGPTIPGVSSIYEIHNLPIGYNVSWTYVPSSNTSLSSGTFITNSPTANQCIINNTSKQYINGTLTATITRGSTTITTLQKEIHSGDGFSATCMQPLGEVLPIHGNVTSNSSTSVSFGDDASFSVRKSSSASYPITLTSPFFTSSTITHTPIMGMAWMKTGNSITMTLPANGNLDPILVVTGKSIADYRVFRFTIYLMMDIPIHLKVTTQGQSVILALVPDEECSKRVSSEALKVFASDLVEREWDFVLSYVLTGKVVYEGHAKGESSEIDIAGWPKGIYAVRATIGKKVLTGKIIVR